MKKIPHHRRSGERGFAVSIITFFVLIIMMTVGLSISSLIFYRQKISTNLVKSNQSYFAAEAGIEDALLKLNNNPQFPAGSYELAVGGVTSTVTISTSFGYRTITGQGNADGINRKVEVVYTMDGAGASFNYGAQVGAGGLVMGNNSAINGNVFSNGNITGSGTIANDVVISGEGNKLDGAAVNGNVLSYSCLNSTVGGNLKYVTGGTNTCNVTGSVSTQSDQIPSQSLPISQTQIDDWKAETAAAEVIVGNYTIGNNQTKSLGPVKITGNLIFGNGSILNITGTIYVQGSIAFGNTNTIRLDSSYGATGGVILLDGSIDTGNSSTFTPTGQTGSYILVLSTSTSDTAITVSNNADGAVFYTSAGGLTLNNNVHAKALTGYKVILSNNAIIDYESGLADVFFSSGPGGGWQVESWEEK